MVNRHKPTGDPHNRALIDHAIILRVFLLVDQPGAQVPLISNVHECLIDRMKTQGLFNAFRQLKDPVPPSEPPMPN